MVGTKINVFFYTGKKSSNEPLWHLFQSTELRQIAKRAGWFLEKTIPLSRIAHKHSCFEESGATMAPYFLIPFSTEKVYPWEVSQSHIKMCFIQKLLVRKLNHRRWKTLKTVDITEDDNPDGISRPACGHVTWINISTAFKPLLLKSQLCSLFSRPVWRAQENYICDLSSFG